MQKVIILLVIGISTLFATMGMMQLSDSFYTEADGVNCQHPAMIEAAKKQMAAKYGVGKELIVINNPTDVTRAGMEYAYGLSGDERVCRYVGSFYDRKSKLWTTSFVKTLGRGANGGIVKRPRDIVSYDTKKQRYVTEKKEKKCQIVKNKKGVETLKCEK